MTQSNDNTIFSPDFRTTMVLAMATVALLLSFHAHAEEQTCGHDSGDFDESIRQGCSCTGDVSSCVQHVEYLVNAAHRVDGGCATPEGEPLCTMGLDPSAGPDVWLPLFELAKRPDLPYSEGAMAWKRCLDRENNRRTLSFAESEMVRANKREDGTEDIRELTLRTLATALLWIQSTRLDVCLAEYHNMPADQVRELVAEYTDEDDGGFDWVHLIPGADCYNLGDKLLRGHSVGWGDIVWASTEVASIGFPIAKGVGKGGRVLWTIARRGGIGAIEEFGAGLILQSAVNAPSDWVSDYMLDVFGG